MICIISQGDLEPTTEDVIDWLRYWGVPYVRLNSEDIQAAPVSMSVSATGSTVAARIGHAVFQPKSIKVVWYRRWNSYIDHALRKVRLFPDSGEDFQGNTVAAITHLRRELRSVSTFLFSSMSSARWLTEERTSSVNKLLVLRAASECGLDVPDTLISNDRSDLADFVTRHSRVITKAIDGMLVLDDGDRKVVTYTSLVSLEADLMRTGLTFPTLFQECLNKEYEIRAFYLDGSFHAMAIFSQSDEQTSIDFRRYQYKRPNRTVPYLIPAALEAKLRHLMQRLGLETGSIDLIKTREGRFVFLEVNPVGQFGMVSYPCNYHLEHAVASALVRRLKHEEECERSFPV
jgi:ATP-GRASP peptide maturase of grasp-with-spasm system